MDYRTAFDLAPIGLVLSSQRLMTDCNARALAIFGAAREQLVGQSFELLYPTQAEYERTGQRIVARLDEERRQIAPLERPRDEAVPGTVPAAAAPVGEQHHATRLARDGEVADHGGRAHSGRALDPHQPHAAGIWAFEDLSSRRPLKVDFTAREREIAALLIDGLTSKLIGKRLGISPRTVDVYRARLMRKLGGQHRRAGEQAAQRLSRAIGGGSKPRYSVSSQRAKRRHTGSANTGPAIWAPIGSPPCDNPSGTAVAGRPHRLV